MKTLWLDLETTGLKAKENGVVQIGAKMEVGGKVVDSFVTYVQPLPGDIIEDKALEVNGLTREQLLTFPEAKEVLIDLKAWLEKYVNKYDKTDKLVMGGYNVQFDMDFLRAWFNKQNETYFGSYFFWLPIDVMRHLIMYYTVTGIKIPMLKGEMTLITAAKRHGVFIDNAHDAEADITMTRELYHKINSTFMRDYIYASDR